MTRFFKVVVGLAAGIAVSLLGGLSTSLPAYSNGPEPLVAPLTAETAVMETDRETTEESADTGILEGLSLPQRRVTPPAEEALPLPPNSEDPADQVAPPGLDVQPGDMPITPFMAIAMRQELDGLMGRFESALFLANAAGQPQQLQTTDLSVDRTHSTLIASVESPLAPETPETPMPHPVLVEARQLMQDWQGLIDNRAYQEARDRWLTVRQTLWENFPTDRAFAQPEIRAMWLDRGSIVRAGSPQRLAALFDRMQESGINTVFFETVNASYPIYPSRIAPSQNPLTRRWDPLAAAVDLAHERNMELHAWMWVFAAGNQRHNAILNLPTTYMGPVLNAHSDWAAYANDGNPIPRGQTKPFFDPANPEVRRYLLSIIDEIISTYDVDGLQLDYIRYPFQDPGADRTYGYGLAARQEFYRMTGVDPIELTPRIDPWLAVSERQRLRSLWQQWTDFRIEQVSQFVAAASALVRQKRPDMILSTAVFPIEEHERLQKIQQDWGSWARQGLVDWIVLMGYAQDTHRLTQLIEPWVLTRDYGPTLLIPGIRLLNLSVPATLDQIQALRDLPVPGYALFATDNLDESMQTVLNRTQGRHTGKVPQQAPYQTAAQRFAALQQEWNWLLSNQQMSLATQLADSWTQQVNDLGQTLNALADSLAADTAADIETALAQLQALKRSLGIGMWLQTATTPDYRLQAWENRLESIHRFLAYGAARRD